MKTWPLIFCLISISVAGNPEDEIADRWIVTVKDDEDVRAHADRVHALHRRLQPRESNNTFAGVIEHYDADAGYKGYLGHFHESVVDHIRNLDGVEHVEPDQVVYSSFSTAPPGPEIVTQAGAPWNLAAISHRQALKPNEQDFVHTKDNGQYASVYVIDSGILAEHAEFDNRKRRVYKGINIVSYEAHTDKYGHGTHVAGIIGGKTYGIAKECDFYDVKILNHRGAGTLSGILQGLNWCSKSIMGMLNQDRSVINMSLGSMLKSFAKNRAMSQLQKKGITLVTSAGNDGEPASMSNTAIVVGAADMERKRAWFSNYGDRVTLFAPGVDIKSAWIGVGNKETKVASGTSQAAPHVAGVVAALKSEQYAATLKPAPMPPHVRSEGVEKLQKPKKPKKKDMAVEMKALLMKLATPNAIKDGRSGTNAFLYNGSGK